MNRPLHTTTIINDVAAEAAEQITHKVRKYLQSLEYTLSAEDSGLENIWEEVCVQLQDEKSVFWQTYEETIETAVDAYVKEVPPYQQEALWLKTEPGWEWDSNPSEEREDDPVVLSDIVEYLMGKWIYPDAMEWSNFRIRAYLEMDS